MYLHWVNLAFWPLAALIAVPILVHLFARTRPPQYLFSSVAFIARVVRQTLRIRRPRQWLVLLLRTLAVAALVMLIMRPVGFASRGAATAFERRNVVLLVDRSASMAYAEGGQTRFASASAEASAVLGGLTGRDRANLVWLDAGPDAVFPEMGVNVGFLQNAIRRAGVSREEGHVEAALQHAASLLAEAEGRKELCIISDFQQTQWGEVDLALPADIQVVSVKVGEGAAPNVALTDVRCTPPSCVPGETVVFRCYVENYSDTPVRRTVYLRVEEARLAQELTVPPWGTALASFDYRFSKAGETPVRAVLTEDAFAADDSRDLVVPVREFFTAAVSDGADETALMWRRAVHALGLFRLMAFNAEEHDVPELVMLSEWHGESLEQLHGLAGQGGTVIVAPGDGVSAQAIRALLGLPGGALTPRRRELLPEPAHVSIQAPEDPLFALFADGSYADPAAGLFRARLRIAPDDVAGATLLLAYGDGTPALVRAAGERPLFLWNLPLGRAESDWSSQSAFLPFFGELVTSGRRGDAVVDVVPGGLLARGLPSGSRPDDVRLLNAADEEVPLALTLDRGQPMLTSAPVALPGIYRWSAGDQPLGYSAVNFPRRESDLRALTPEALARKSQAVVESGSRLRRLQEGTPLWPWLLLAAGLFMAAELLLIWLGDRAGLGEGTS